MSNSKPNPNVLRTGTWISVVVAVLLMTVLRVDWWWWGKPQGIIMGWLTPAILYHLLIWAAGFVLVLLTVAFLWPDPPKDNA